MTKNLSVTARSGCGLGTATAFTSLAVPVNFFRHYFLEFTVSWLIPSPVY